MTTKAGSSAAVTIDGGAGRQTIKKKFFFKWQVQMLNYHSHPQLKKNFFLKDIYLKKFPNNSNEQTSENKIEKKKTKIPSEEPLKYFFRARLTTPSLLN